MENKKINSISVKTDLGSFQIETSEKGLYALKFPSFRKSSHCEPERRSNPDLRLPQRGYPHHIKSYEKVLPRRPLGAPRNDNEFLSRAQKLLQDYLNGKKISFRSLKIDYTGFTKLEREVLQALSRVPSGQVLSYAQLAKKIGRPKASRFIGSVMRKNRLPIILPCHRVVRSDGGLGGYSLGLEWKKKLLSMEGSRF